MKKKYIDRKILKMYSKKLSEKIKKQSMLYLKAGDSYLAMFKRFFCNS